VGPILGGALYDWVQFRSTCDIFSGSAAILGIVYFFVGILPPLFKKKNAGNLKMSGGNNIQPPKSAVDLAFEDMEREEFLRS